MFWAQFWTIKGVWKERCWRHFHTAIVTKEVFPKPLEFYPTWNLSAIQGFSLCTASGPVNFENILKSQSTSQISLPSCVILWISWECAKSKRKLHGLYWYSFKNCPIFLLRLKVTVSFKVHVTDCKTPYIYIQPLFVLQTLFHLKFSIMVSNSVLYKVVVKNMLSVGYWPWSHCH